MTPVSPELVCGAEGQHGVSHIQPPPCAGMEDVAQFRYFLIIDFIIFSIAHDLTGPGCLGRRLGSVFRSSENYAQIN